MIDRDYITKTCDSLPMVEWDRCVLIDDYPGQNEGPWT